MRPVRQTVATTGVSDPIVTDHYIGPFNVGFGVEATATTVTYKVQHTFDDVLEAGYNPATGLWFDNDLGEISSGSSDGNYAFPVTAIRVNVSANTSGNPVNFTVVQAGRAGG